MNAATSARRGLFELTIVAIFTIVGIAFALPGLQLATLGGSFYYLIVGVAFVLCGLLLFRRHRAAVPTYGLILGGTLVWSLWESGLDGWALLPRLDVIVGLGILLWLSRWLAHRSGGRRSGTGARIAAAAAVVLAVGAGLFLTFGRGGAFASVDARPVAAAPSMADGDWQHLGRTVGADRFSPLQQIDASNVGKLEVAWRIHLGMLPAGSVGALEGPPLKIGDTLYACNTANVVLAIDPETGAVRWTYDPKVDPSVINMGICRGLTYHKAANATGPCAERIIDTIYDGRLAALDAKTGKLCPDFGKGGIVNLLDGMGPTDKGYYYITSPATLVRNILVVGGSVLDGQKIDEPSGVIRGYDVLTGKLAWAWDMGRPGKTGMPGAGESYTRGTPNAWPPMSGDDRLGLVFVPLGNATPDYVTAHRTPEMNKYGSSIVAIDVTTGTPRWHFQTTHRDVWDYDNPSAATTVEFPTAQGSRPGLIVPTKRGVFFVLDRRTGQPLVETVEKPVPQGAVPGETLSPTQPYPVGMPSFTGDRLTEAKMWGVTPFDQLWCRIKFRQARYDGDYTPIGLDRASIIYPGFLGGSEWGGVSVDPERNIMVLNVNHFPMYNRMARRANVDFQPMVVGKGHYDAGRTAQTGTPYAAMIKPFVSPLNVPCTQPPYSEIAAVDLKTRQTLWRKPFGTSRDSGPQGLASMLPLPMGVPAIGGSMVTRSGLLFIAATQEKMFRAFDTRTGRLLWQRRLPAAGHSNPISYYSDKSGRQFVIIAASGHPMMADGNSDEMIAYALPRR